MKTAMQEMFEELCEYKHIVPFRSLAKCKELMAKEKEQIVNAYKEGCSDSILDESTDEERAKEYYNETFNKKVYVCHCGTSWDGTKCTFIGFDENESSDQETGYTDGTATQTEGSDKGVSDFTLEAKDAPVRTNASYIRVSRQILDDTALPTSYINQRLEKLFLEEDDQILYGNGMQVTLSNPDQEAE